MLVDELIAGGVTDIVAAPGSRSAPLAFALHQADAAGRIRLHMRIDERGAGFLALGLARATGRPVPVVTTSGTAVANLHPAVLEAHHDGVPLLVLSADRPPQLRGVGANQVIDQLTVFGSGVLRFQHEFAVAGTRLAGGYWRGQVCRALAACRGALSSGWPGPAQLNIPFDLPLVPDIYDASDADLPPARSGGPATRIEPLPPLGAAIDSPGPGERCLVISDLTHELAGPLAAAGHLVIGEAGGLAGSAVLSAGMHLLADEGFLAGHLPERVIVLGRPTLFRAVTALLARQDVIVDVVDHPARYADLAGTVRAVGSRLADAVGDRVVDPVVDRWRQTWRRADAAAREAIGAALAGGDISSSAGLARAIGAALPEGATLMLGSSQPPRDIARFTRPRGGVRVLANRGVAGIDGAVSTAIGATLGCAAPTVALLGDLTFLHDVTALAIGPHEPRPDLTIVVANNDGGGIFATLEQGAPEYGRAFERVFGTPTGAQIAQLCEGFCVDHRLVVTADELAATVSEPPAGIRVIEVPVGRTDLREFSASVAGRVRAALSS